MKDHPVVLPFLTGLALTFEAALGLDRPEVLLPGILGALLMFGIAAHSTVERKMG